METPSILKVTHPSTLVSMVITSPSNTESTVVATPSYKEPQMTLGLRLSRMERKKAEMKKAKQGVTISIQTSATYNSCPLRHEDVFCVQTRYRNHHRLRMATDDCVLSCFCCFCFYLISAAFFLFLFSRYYIHLLNILINFLPLTLWEMLIMQIKINVVWQFKPLALFCSSVSLVKSKRT